MQGTNMTPTADAAMTLPSWLPENARLYLAHTECGRSIRALAREEGCHASTVLRRVRSFENLRDDPLVDAALTRIGRAAGNGKLCGLPVCRAKESETMSAPIRNPIRKPDDKEITREARRVLRRLCEAEAILAVADGMDKAAVLRGSLRIAVLERRMAEAFAIKGWIACRAKQGRVATYQITAPGRAALKRLIAAEDGARTGAGQAGFSEAPQTFADQHREWTERSIATEDGGPRRMRCNLAESPVAVLARRIDKDGQPFLSPELVAAGERLREDFELAQMGPRVAQNWEKFLTGGDRGSFAGTGLAEGPARARERVAAALRDLGPGLGDVALRCCCFLEGLEAAEQRMGWSARSGKIVLRIALMRLRRHYEDTYGGAAPLIG